MRSRVFGFAVVVAALAASINAMAYKTATVTNKVTFALVNTTSAGLAFSAPTSVDPGLTVDTATNGILEITLNESLQRESTYKWSQAFKITNNAGYPVTLTYATGASWPAGVTIKLYDSATNTDISGASLAAAGAMDVDLELTVDNTAALAAATTYDFTVTGTR